MSSGGYTSHVSDGGVYIVGAMALAFYEYLITFKVELQYVWRRHFSVATVLFALNRYAMLAASLASTAQILQPELVGEVVYSQVCKVTLRLADICVMIVYMAYAAFAALRMYAIHGMSKTILITILFTGIMGPCVQVFLIATENVSTTFGILSDGRIGPDTIGTIRPLGGIYCVHGPRGIASLGRSVEWVNYSLIALRAHALVFELILIGLLWNRTINWRSLQSPLMHTPFTTVLLRDGTLYFIVIAAINGLNLGGMVAFSRDEDEDFVHALLLLGPTVDTITSICMSRFLLGLFAAAEGEHDSQYRSSRWNSIVRFASVGTMGARVQDIPEDLGEDDIEDVRENASICADEVDWEELDITSM